MKIYIFYFIILFVFTSVGYAQKDDKGKKEYVHLYLTLGDGFLPEEQIILRVQRSTGEDSVIYNHSLKRLSIDGVNGFDVLIEKGCINKVILICPQRGVSCSHDFLIHNYTYLEVNLEENNTFLLISGDEPFTYE